MSKSFLALVGVIFLSVLGDLLLILAVFVGFCFITILKTDLKKEESTRYKLFISGFSLLVQSASHVGIVAESFKRTLRDSDP